MMDPNACLVAILATPVSPTCEDLLHAAERADALRTWLRNGGRAPDRYEEVPEAFRPVWNEAMGALAHWVGASSLPYGRERTAAYGTAIQLALPALRVIADQAARGAL